MLAPFFPSPGVFCFLFGCVPKRDSPCYISKQYEAENRENSNFVNLSCLFAACFLVSSFSLDSVLLLSPPHFVGDWISPFPSRRELDQESAGCNPPYSAHCLGYGGLPQHPHSTAPEIGPPSIFPTKGISAPAPRRPCSHSSCARAPHVLLDPRGPPQLRLLVPGGRGLAAGFPGPLFSPSENPYWGRGQFFFGCLFYARYIGITTVALPLFNPRMSWVPHT